MAGWAVVCTRTVCCLNNEVTFIECRNSTSPSPPNNNFLPTACSCLFLYHSPSAKLSLLVAPATKCEVKLQMTFSRARLAHTEPRKCTRCMTTKNVWNGLFKLIINTQLRWVKPGRRWQRQRENRVIGSMSSFMLTSSSSSPSFFHSFRLLDMHILFLWCRRRRNDGARARKSCVRNRKTEFSRKSVGASSKSIAERRKKSRGRD